MKIYELIDTEFGQALKASEGEKISWIPLDPANSDYAEYLELQAWLADGKKEKDFWNRGN